jgi:hypothetical protein
MKRRLFVLAVFLAIISILSFSCNQISSSDLQNIKTAILEKTLTIVFDNNAAAMVRLTSSGEAILLIPANM